MSNTHKDLMQTLRHKHMTEYGSFIPLELVHKVLDVEMPESGAKSVFDRIALVEMAAIDYCRNILLGEGKYIRQVKNGYRILLPSENAGQIQSYMESADKKLKRALKLNRNSPGVSSVSPDQTEARILMKLNRPAFA